MRRGRQFVALIRSQPGVASATFRLKLADSCLPGFAPKIGLARPIWVYPACRALGRHRKRAFGSAGDSFDALWRRRATASIRPKSSIAAGLTGSTAAEYWTHQQYPTG